MDVGIVKGTSSGWCGRDPVASREAGAEGAGAVVVGDDYGVAIALRSGPSVAAPCRNSTPWRSKLAATACIVVGDDVGDARSGGS